MRRRFLPSFRQAATLIATASVAAIFWPGAAESTPVTFTSVSDAYVSAASPTQTSALLSYVKVMGTSQPRNAYLKFSVSGLAGTVTSATLRLWTLTAGDPGVDLHAVANNSWDESTLTWNNAPPYSPTITSSSGPFATGTWISLDVTPLVTGNGTYSFALTSANTTGIQLASKDGNASQRPQLVVDTSALIPPANTAPPTISGAAQDGQTLNASTGTWSGSAPLNYAYQWQRCDSGGANCSPIVGATSATYAIGSGDVGSTLAVVVTASNSAGSSTAGSAASAVVSAAPPANTSPPTISGNAVSGQVLTGAAGAWTGTGPLTYSYQWRDCDSGGLNCADIPGANGSTYTLTPLDVGYSIVLSVTVANGVGNASAASARTAVVTPPPQPPANSTPPSISGTPQDGQTLTASTGSWTGTAPISYAYQWKRCDGSGGACTPISGANGATYVASSADVGSTLRVDVTATNAVGSATATSGFVGQVSAVAPSNTSPPTISGAANDGQTLSAGTGQWAGTLPLSFAYQWRWCDATGVNCIDIPSATTSTYTLSSNDDGFTIVVVVTASNVGGSAAAASAPTAVVSPPLVPPANSGSPTISGPAVDGQTLTATTGAWTGTGPFTYQYQWRRCDATGAGCSDIAGATASSYVLASADVGSTIRVVVTAANASGSASASSDPTATVAAAPPVSTAAPAISGTAKDGQTLAASTGTWNGTLPLSYAYGWQRCDASGSCTAISGATSASYTATAADVGFTLVAAVTASNSAGNATALSVPTATVSSAAPSNSTLPTISGTAQEGQSVTATAGTWTGTPPLAYAFQWRRCNTSGANCTDIAGATSSVYTVVTADVGSTLRVAVTAQNAAGSTTALSGPTAVVSGLPPANTALPAISGVAQDGQTLSASTGTWSGTQPFTYTYRWRRCDASGATCTDIASATQSSYILASADVGSTVRVVVTATNGAGSASATSAQTATVAAASPANVTPPTASGTTSVGSVLTAATGTWSGTTPLTYAYQWRRCDSGGANCGSVAGATGSTYTLVSGDAGTTFRVAVTASNAAGSATATSSATAVIASASDPVVAAEGDIACDPTSANWNGGNGTTSNCHQKATAAVVASINPSALLGLGDEQYECAGTQAFAQSYGPTWGQFKGITHPVPGNHEYQTSGGLDCDTTGKATGYFNYFGAAAGDPTKGYYSYNVGTWHIIALNSNCSIVKCAAGSPQETWLKADLAANTAQCTLAYWHHARFSSDQYVGNNTDTAAFWTDLYNANADLVLSGHSHEYERFAPQNPSGAADPTRGIREFIVGTGGRNFSTFGTIKANSEVRNAVTFGALKLVLHPTSYEFQFIPEAGKTFTDSGSGTCH